MLGKEPKNIFLQFNKPLLWAISDCCHLLEMSTKNPTPCNELVTGWNHYIGVKDASRHEIGGIIMGEGKACTPTVLRLAWLDYIKELFHKGDIKKLDLEMAGLLMLRIVMEEVCTKLRAAYVALFSDNSPTIGWVKHLAARESLVAMKLVQVLTPQLKRLGHHR